MRCRGPGLGPWAATWALAGLLGGAACGPPEPIEVLYPRESGAARQVLSLDFMKQITLPDLFVLRPDEFGGVAPHPSRGLLYAGSRDGMLLALDADTGAVVWERDFLGAVSSVPVAGLVAATVKAGSAPVAPLTTSV